jgi:hypothetical protein
MKRVCMWFVVFLGVMAFGSQCYSQDTSKVEAQSKAAKVSEAPKTKEKKTVKRHRSSHAFAGVVVRIDAEAKTIVVKGRGKAIGFDMSNPAIRGFRSIQDIKRGSYVSVAYTVDGIRIARISKSEASLAAREAGPGERGVRSGAAKKGTSGRVRVKTKGDDFADIDENKDGKVSAVEMSAVIKNLNMKEFKEYDRNGDGYLDDKEYRAVAR